LGKALRWAKSLLLLQRTRYKVHTLEQAQRDLQTQLNSASVALRNEITRASQEVEAFSESGIDALRQEIATWRRRQDLLAMEIAFQQSRLNRALARQTAAPAPLNPGPAPGPDDLDALYVSFEEVFRGTREEIKGRVRRHVENFALAGAGRSDRPVLDLGCGRGEWL
jgi:O-antigen chain-terminating methyltransferase